MKHHNNSGQLQIIALHLTLFFARNSNHQQKTTLMRSGCTHHGALPILQDSISHLFHREQRLNEALILGIA